MLQATARVEDKGQGDKYRRKELLKKCMSMFLSIYSRVKASACFERN